MEQFDFTDSPLHFQYGAIRVIGSRITLDILVETYHQGYTPEKIQHSFPSLSLDQVNGVISWYLNHTAEADEYIEKGEAEAEELRKKIQSEPGYWELNELIKQRWEQMQNSVKSS